MALLDLNRNPSRRDLLVFGALFAIFFAIVGALLRFKMGAPAGATVVWIAAGTITVAYFLLPPLRRPLYLGWTALTFPIGWVISHAILAVLYYVVFTLTGLAMRALGNDPMQRRFDPRTGSYWVKHRPGGDRARYFRQF